MTKRYVDCTAEMMRGKRPAHTNKDRRKQANKTNKQTDNTNPDTRGKGKHGRNKIINIADPNRLENLW